MPKTPLNNVILLTECKSGSTVFQSELAKHSQINHVVTTPHNGHETHYWTKAACLLGHFAKEVQEVEIMRDFQPAKPWQLLPQKVRFNYVRPIVKRAFGLQAVPKLKLGRADYYWNKSFARSQIISLVQSNVPDFVPPADDEQLVFAGWQALCRTFQPRYFEKTPSHLKVWGALELMLQSLEKSDTDTKFLGLIRNPTSMLYSTWRSWGADPEARQNLWQHSYENLRRFMSLVDPDRFKLITYEELVGDPVQTYQTVCDFIGVQYEDGIGSGIQTKHLEKWRKDDAYRFEPQSSVLELAEFFGYEMDSIRNPLAVAA